MKSDLFCRNGNNDSKIHMQVEETRHSFWKTHTHTHTQGTKCVTNLQYSRQCGKGMRVDVLAKEQDWVPEINSYDSKWHSVRMPM